MSSVAINERAPEQWRIISERVDFKGKSVVDFGCGHCDLLHFVRDAGAVHYVGVDKELKPDCGSQIVFVGDLEKWIVGAVQRYDVSLCFSVLPYLKDPVALLAWMHDHTDVALIECQYAGDGPGLDWLKSDDDMQAWLESIGWSEVQPIGKTLVKGRNRHRTIWLCKS